MSRDEKIAVLADILDLEIDELNESSILDEIESWDSVAVLSVISVMNDYFNAYPSAKEIRKYKTVGDLLNAMQ